MRISIANKSTRVTNEQAQKMADAVQIQMDTQAAPTWDRLPPRIVFCAATVPTDGPVLTLVDSFDVDDALGYHTEGGDGSYFGFIAVNPVLNAGGGVLDGETAGVSVASVVSHEAIEL